MIQKLLLLINATEGRLQLALAPAFSDGFGSEVLAFSQLLVEKGAMEVLTPTLADMLTRVGVQAKDISHIGCVCGPGGFTGMRLAITTAHGLALATGALLTPFNHLQAIAQSLPAAPGESIRIVTRAGGNVVYVQNFIVALQGVLTLAQDNISITTAQKAAFAAGALCSQTLWLSGSGLIMPKSDTLWPEFEQARLDNPKLRLLTQNFAHPTAQGLLTLAQDAHNRNAWQSQELEALYLRPCDAEQNLDHIAALSGRDATMLRQELEKLTHATASFITTSPHIL